MGFVPPPIAKPVDRHHITPFPVEIDCMLPYLAPSLTRLWGPFRLFQSHLVLIGLGTTSAALLTWFLLPRCWGHLPTDRGKTHAAAGSAAKGKPTGAGVLWVCFLIPVLFLVLPASIKLWEVIGCLVLVMVTGYLDDASKTPWGEWRKGSLDLVLSLLTSLALCQGQHTVMWLPLIKGDLIVPPSVFIPLATVLLWLTINATNCSDGVDGLAGSLTLLSLFYLGGFLYAIIGHIESARHLLVPHNPEGAKWSILIFSATGALGGYLWHNAEPSRVLMGDAGSRFLGLLLGVAVLATGNPFIVLVVAPVVLVNGGTGLVKLALLRGFRALGVDVRRPDADPDNGAQSDAEQGQPTATTIIVLLHRIRFPLHDHCRKKLEWSNAQVLLRFVLIQAFVAPILLGLLVKVR